MCSLCYDQSMTPKYLWDLHVVFLVTSWWPITARCLPYLWCHMDINTFKSLKQMFVKQAAFVERLLTSVHAHCSFSSKANVLHWFVVRLANLLACKLFFLCLCLLVSVVLQWVVSPVETIFTIKWGLKVGNVYFCAYLVYLVLSVFEGHNIYEASSWNYGMVIYLST